MNIPTSRWSRLYVMADEILALAPWKKAFEEDLFAIQPKVGGPVYFVSVMGSQGAHHAIAYYPGMESLSHFRMAQMEDIPERMAIEAILLNRHLQLTFEPKRNLFPADLDILKSLGKTYRGKWPVFRSHSPARMPWFPNAQELEDFESLLEQTLVVLRRLGNGEDLFQPFDEKEFFLRTKNGDWEDSTCRVADLPVAQHILKAELPPGCPRRNFKDGFACRGRSDSHAHPDRRWPAWRGSLPPVDADHGGCRIGIRAGV